MNTLTQSFPRTLALALCLALALGTTATAAAEDAPHKEPTTDPHVLLAALRVEAAQMESHRTGKLRYSRDEYVDRRARYVALMRVIANAHIREATPDLLYLLANDIEPLSVIFTLDKMRDERAIVQLLCTARKQVDDVYRRNFNRAFAGKALLNYRAPLAPMVLLGLRSEDLLHLRRSLFAVRVLDTATEPPEEGLRTTWTEEEVARFQVTDALRDELRRLFHHVSPTVRFEAAVMWLRVRGGDIEAVRAALGDDTDPSIRALLAEPDLVLKHYQSLDPAPEDGSVVQWIDYAAVDPATPPAREYRHQSEWVAMGESLSIRMSLTAVDLRLPQTLYELNPGVWARVELRNHSNAPLTLSTPFGSTRPSIYPLLFDSLDRFVPLTVPDSFLCGLGAPPPTTTLAPGQIYPYSFNLLKEVRLRYNGHYTLCAPGAHTPVLLNLTVRDLPAPLWLEEMPRKWSTTGEGTKYALNKEHTRALGVPMGGAYVSGNGGFSTNFLPGSTLYPHMELADGPAEVYAHLPPLDSAKDARIPAVVVGEDGRVERVLTYVRGVIAERTDYNRAGRLVQVIKYDSSGKTTHRSQTLYNTAGARCRIESYGGKDLTLHDYTEFSYDAQGRLAKWEECKADGTPMAYRLYDYDKRNGGMIWYEYLKLNGSRGATWIDPPQEGANID